MHRTRLPRPVAAVVLVALAAAGVVVAAAAPAAAHTDPTPATGPAQDHPWSDDGCSVVADSVDGLFQFTHACQHHDGCYAASHGPLSRFACDVAFYYDMSASCQTRWTAPEARDECERVAVVYFIGVRLFGGVYSTGV